MIAVLSIADPSFRAPASFVGYDGIQYLLDNWNKETFKKCGVDGQVALRDECDRDANKVPAVLGLKSTDAPLFKVERSFKAVLLSGDIDDMDKWTEATDAFVQHATSAQEYAYTASFGEHDGGVRHETGHLVLTGGPSSPGARLASNRPPRPSRRYNPSGGKDQVAKYMDLSKNELVLARDALKSILLQAGQKL